MPSTVTVEWNLNYLFISFAMAFLGSYSAVSLAELYRVVCRIHSKFIGPQVTLFLMSISIGFSAIWSMHFVGMNAITVSYETTPLETNLNLFITILSLLAAITCVYFGFYVSSRDQMFTMSKEEFIQLILSEVKSFQSLRDNKILFKLILLRNPLPLILGGSIMGSGVIVMHYLGMMAVSTENTKMHWSVGIIITSIFIAIIASSAAYWILFRLLALYPTMESIRLGSACVLTVAVCAVHYIGMLSASYSYDQPNSSSSSPSSSSSSTPFSSTVSKGSVVPIVILLSLIYNFLISMIVQAELRSCYYRLSSLDQILNSTQEDPHLQHQSFFSDYQKWKEKYWKVISQTSLQENHFADLDFLKYLRKNQVISPDLEEDRDNPSKLTSPSGVTWKSFPGESRDRISSPSFRRLEVKPQQLEAMDI
jgi:NO-binding membrane sensor protein with MHYT domain